MRPMVLEITASGDNEGKREGDAPDGRLRRAGDRATITHLTHLRFSPSSASASSSPAAPPPELLLYSHVGPIASACSNLLHLHGELHPLYRRSLPAPTISTPSPIPSSATAITATSIAAASTAFAATGKPENARPDQPGPPGVRATVRSRLAISKLRAGPNWTEMGSGRSGPARKMGRPDQISGWSGPGPPK